MLFFCTVSALLMDNWASPASKWFNKLVKFNYASKSSNKKEQKILCDERKNKQLKLESIEKEIKENHYRENKTANTHYFLYSSLSWKIKENEIKLFGNFRVKYLQWYHTKRDNFSLSTYKQNLINFIIDFRRRIVAIQFHNNTHNTLWSPSMNSLFSIRPRYKNINEISG